MKTPPKFLYKCMGKRLDHIGDILVNRRLHFSNPANFNDPFDCALGLDLNREATDEEWVEYLIHVLEQEEPDSSPDYRRDKAKDNVGRGRHKDPEFVSKTQDRIRRGIKEVGQDQGILCLTSDPKNIMMWAHYADNHEGLFLKFDHHYMEDQNSGEIRCFPVDYISSFPGICDYLAALRKLKNGDERAFPKFWFCSKSKDWKNEKEWRLFANTPNCKLEFNDAMLSGIIFGWKMPNCIRNLIMTWIGDYTPNPKLFEAMPSQDGFRMNIRPIHGRWK